MTLDHLQDFPIPEYQMKRAETPWPCIELKGRLCASIKINGVMMENMIGKQPQELTNEIT